MIGKRLIRAPVKAAPPPRSRLGRHAGGHAKVAQIFRRKPAVRRTAGFRSAPYFSAPAVRPATTCRWKMMYAASTGSIAIVSPANRPDQSPL